ncbi:MAG: NUDIX hydrolase, partial [Anaerolineales bacterium]
KEEIGVEFETGAVAFSSVMHRTEDDERVDFFLHIAKWQGEPVNAEPDKCDQVCWVEVNNLPLNTIPYVRQAIQNHLNQVRFDEFGW